MAPLEGSRTQPFGRTSPGDVVEIGLLLPATWADALVELSKRRGQSVGQILRGMIDRALVDESALRP